MTEKEILRAASEIDSPVARRDYLQRVCPGDEPLQQRLARRLAISDETGYLLDDGDESISDAGADTIELKTYLPPDPVDQVSRQAVKSGVPAKFVGESLARRLSRQKRLPVDEAMRIGCEVADGLMAGHRNGLIHLDVGPFKIVLEPYTGRVRLSDSGLARVGGERPSITDGQVSGTPQYISPEQACGLPVDARSDLFSLGVVLYEMCSGRSPFRAEDSGATARRVCEEDPPGLQELCPDAPPEFATLVNRLMSKSPSERVQTAREVSAALRQLLVAFDRTRFPHVAGTAIA